MFITLPLVCCASAFDLNLTLCHLRVHGSNFGLDHLAEAFDLYPNKYLVGEHPVFIDIAACSF